MEFMSEFARYLVAAGISSDRFAAIARRAFYNAASRDARFRNRRLNQSAVAAMTGLTRVQVRGLSKQESAEFDAGPDRLEKIIEGWASDPVFVTSNYSPRRLGIGHQSAGFNALVRKYGGDIPARSILRELVRVGCVTVEKKLATLHPRARRTLGQARLHSLSTSLAELIRESESCFDARRPLKTINGQVLYRTSSAKGRILMERRMARGLSALMTELQIAGNAASVESPPEVHQAGRVTRARIVLVSEEMDCPEDD